jgi:hypothetical protein
LHSASLAATLTHPKGLRQTRLSADPPKPILNGLINEYRRAA